MNSIEAARINRALVTASNLASFLALQVDMMEEPPAKRAKSIRKLTELVVKAEAEISEAEALLNEHAA